ncbi:Holliday junction DNA helicase subunit RuvA [Alkalispirochaeta americana]|uniref:Holliday junction branch migration complex subunit RuvA n=1 Tax=Alkalispirochaeta americana TaxID=159291 RepID=A0A1N6P9P1_9SPIO|nr:Holliday junction branch migration protein RuvA [Alkalispirochaeta americana]SIQ00976.1 Holliday junction DNA helicase subunit RuvA [Alkalispirochaeta americana]
MFHSLTGRISGHQFPFLFLETGGIEWELEVSAATFQASLAAERSEPVRLLVYLQTREDLLKLFGFWTDSERQAFLQLITVPGIGPRQALKILSGTTVTQLTQFLEEEDLSSLTRIPGLGTKTAQKMILQLKGHLVREEPSGKASSPAPAGPLEELATALVDMGYDKGAVRKVLDRLYGELKSLSPPDGESSRKGSASAVTDQQEQELFRRAIRELSS